MATKKQKRERGLAKREAFLAEERERGLAALKAQKDARAKKQAEETAKLKAMGGKESVMEALKKFKVVNKDRGNGVIETILEGPDGSVIARDVEIYSNLQPTFSG
jgi:hypothetical protein